jgi:hypothetical protein
MLTKYSALASRGHPDTICESQEARAHCVRQRGTVVLARAAKAFVRREHLAENTMAW